MSWISQSELPQTHDGLSSFPRAFAVQLLLLAATVAMLPTFTDSLSTIWR